MKHCAYCHKRLPPKRRRYCDDDCAKEFRSKGPRPNKVDLTKYNEAAPHPDLDLTKEGLWMMVSRETDPQEAIGDFMREFERAPDHLIPENWWLFVGPVYTEEERARRWQGREKELDRAQKRYERKKPAKKKTTGTQLKGL